MKPEKAVTRMWQVLESERFALTQGDFDGLAALAAEKETLMATLLDAGLTSTIAGDISDALAQNQRLLVAAMDGVGSARKALETSREMAKGGVVYGRDGTVSRMPGSVSGLSQKF